MRKLLFMIVALGLIQYANAQDCKFRINEIDEFTRSKKIETKVLKMTKGFYQTVHLGFKKINEDYYVFFGMSPGRTVMEDDELLFKTDNGLIIKAIATKTTLPLYEMSGSSVWLYYSIKKEDLDVLSKSKIETIRMEFIDTYGDFDVSEKNKPLINKYAICILNATL